MSPEERDRLAIDLIRRNLEAAENATDPDAVAVHLADEVVLMVPDYPVQEGKTAAVSFLREIMAWIREYLHRRIEYVSAEVAVLGEVAFDRGTFSFVVSPKAGGDAETVTGKYLWLLTRDGAVWKMFRVIISRDEPPDLPTEVTP
jgi:ketosteroid isomerase-like protein